MRQKYETEFIDRVLNRGVEHGNFILVTVSGYFFPMTGTTFGSCSDLKMRIEKIC